MSTDNNAAVAATVVGNNAGNVSPEQWQLCGSITGIKFGSPSDNPLNSMYSIGEQMRGQGLEKWVSNKNGIKNAEDITILVVVMGVLIYEQSPQRMMTYTTTLLNY